MASQRVLALLLFVLLAAPSSIQISAAALKSDEQKASIIHHWHNNVLLGILCARVLAKMELGIGRNPDYSGNADMIMYLVRPCSRTVTLNGPTCPFVMYMSLSAGAGYFPEGDRQGHKRLQ